MKTPRSQVAKVIAAKLDGTSERVLASEVAAYLLAEDRTGELDSLARDLVAVRADSGIVEVTAVSVYKLAGTALADIEARVSSLYPSAKKIIINQRLDSAQVGGVRLEFPSAQLDLSVRQKLNKFKQLTGAGA